MTFKRLALFALPLLLLACGDFERGAPSPAGGTDDDIPTPVTDGTNGDPDAVFGDIHPVLIDRCAGCHGASSATAYRLTGDADADYAVVAGLVDLAAPTESTLLRKGAGESPHGGGAVWTAGDDDYQAVLAWIEAGANP